ncbi:MAG: helix-turn-helix domain-containing protein [Oscillospiraceae bacterium]|jgi:transcriptional regulator with XRE-family HTH domain|nr:helix-turn-helix domain-containing protein [Oscillospiraceae bacterium]
MIKLRLRELRKQNGLTQDEVAAHLNIARVTYSRYESSDNEMTYESLALLADLYSVSVDCLLGRSSPKIFSKAEIAMVDRYRSLDDRGKQSVVAVIEHEYACLQSRTITKKTAM